MKLKDAGGLFTCLLFHDVTLVARIGAGGAGSWKLEGIGWCEPEKTGEGERKGAAAIGASPCVNAELLWGSQTHVKARAEVDGSVREPAYLVAERLLLSVDPEQHGLLRVVALHLHHDVVLVGLVFGAENTFKGHKSTVQGSTGYVLKWLLSSPGELN